MRETTILVTLALVLTCVSLGDADEIEMLNGKKMTGRIVEETADTVTIFVTMPGGGDVEMKISKKTIYALTTSKKRTIINQKRVATESAQVKPEAKDGNGAEEKIGESGRKTLTRKEVNELIEKAGKSDPDWWDSTPLNYPQTLDLSFPQPKRGSSWNTRKNVRQYMWSVINENPSRWKQGTRFMHFVLESNKNNPDAQKKCINQLSHCYHDLLQDWARAAYWFRKSDNPNLIALANCYWQLGQKEMAVTTLKKIRFDRTRYGSAIKLWSDMGELKKALALADATARAGNLGAAYIAAGDACRKHGKFKNATEYYNKVLATKQSGRPEILKKNKTRARVSINNIKYYDTLDLQRVPDGTYTASAPSYNGNLSVLVTVKDHRIESVRITKHQDKQFFSALTATPRLIIEKQSIKEVDATTGATITAEAIIAATAKALGENMQ